MTRAPDAARDRIESALTGPLGALGLDLEAVVVTPAGNRRVLRVAVDADGGVTLDTIADATSVVSDTLDGSDVMGERPYTLEVTSRGVDSPLTLPRHWRRNTDRLVTVATADDTSVTGRIRSSDESGVVLDVDGREHVIAFASVVKAKIQVEFSRKEG